MGLQAFKACPHCMHKHENLMEIVMTFFNDRGLDPRPSKDKPEVIELIVSSH